MGDAAVRLRQRLARPEPLVMGVLNVTPDSFSDGGRYTEVDAAVARAQQMVEEGAELIDIGGESTRPGAEAVPLDEERRRVLPLLEALAERVDVPLSIDTSKPEIMTEAGAAGVALINDVRALAAPGALSAAAALDASVCVMHMQGEPRSMQTSPYYDNVVREVGDFLEERIAACIDAGIGRDRLVVDPGFGFGKTLDHNLSLLRHLATLIVRLDLPLLAGMSRKRMIGTLTGGAPAEERLYGSLAAAVLAAERGARVLRVHDVRPTVEALAIVQATMKAE
ncbi:dihydropteroate synthase [Halofilum ochraceum]|uniref:dihydropteroate synthase n=1 Tax=Halofilum ochraceum TaxID=1611323 RepID=UPI0008D93988|nr:dihydropteroate synthase [Halofilum ochraceum]